MEPTPQIDSSSSNPAKLEAMPCGQKRKKFVNNKGDECSTTAFSANSHTPVGKKLQKISEASGFCNFLSGLDRGEFGSVTKDIERLQALKKSRLLRIYSEMGTRSSFTPLEDVKKKRLVNHKITSVPQSAVVNLEDAHPQDHFIAADKPVIILESDEEEDADSFLHSKGAMNGLDQKLSMRDSTVKNCQIVKALMDEARSSPANYGVHLDGCRYTNTRNDLQVKNGGKVSASNDFVGGLLDECSVQEDESSHRGMESKIRVLYSANVKDSMNENADLIGKRDIQVDVSSNTGIDSDRFIKEDNHRIHAEDDAAWENEIKHNIEDSYGEHHIQVEKNPSAGMEKHMIIKGDNNQTDVQHYDLTEIYADLNSLEDENSKCHVIAADVPVITLDSDEEDSGYQRPRHKFPMEKITVKACQVVGAPEDGARSSPANCGAQIDRREYTESKRSVQLKDRKKDITSRSVVGYSSAECKIQVDESPYPAVGSDIQVGGAEKVKNSRDLTRDYLGICNGLVDLCSYTENDMVIKNENQPIGFESDASSENDFPIRRSGKVEVSRDVITDLPAKCSKQVDQSATAGMENRFVVKEDTKTNIEGNDLAKIDTEDNFHDGDSNMAEASTDFKGSSPEKCIIQVDGITHSVMKVNLERKEETRKIDVEDDVLTKSDTEDDSQGTQGKKVKAIKDILAGSGVDKSTYSCVKNDTTVEEDDDQIGVEEDGLSDIWKEMSFALECSKDTTADHSTYEHIQEDAENCDHSFILKDDIGYVCRVCGIIERSIDTIFEFQYSKRRSTRTYANEHRDAKGKESADFIPVGIQSPDLMITQISAHPRHRKEMKPHQVEGFNFLCTNLVSDTPGGCILAHAPGSGKTFMIISFIQSFLAKYPNARPLVVLPKGILTTWKKEFQIWQVEDIPLHDFYTLKAENRSQQLDVLKRWVKEKSILFLGYKQLSVIVCDSGSSKEAAECQKILISVPSILILDEGHTPRNDETDILQSLSRIQTPRKVVLSGTLYQNHVKEVFNILQLVHPQFLKLKASRMIVNRIMSRVQISRVRKQLKRGTDSHFFYLIEYTIQKDEDFKRKKAVIQDLREMTSKVLHYYKGDFLDALPGLVDFTVVLNLSARQKDEVQKLRKLDKFKRSSVGSAVYMHPELKNLSQFGEKGLNVDDTKIDDMLKNLDVREGVKTKYFLNILRLCDSAGEKLLVFSQYILPLKLLERLSANIFGWSLGKELFMITGDSNAEQRERCMEQFNGSPSAKVFFGSIKACGEGISLVGASRIIILDVHLNPSVSRQAIGRAFRPGQRKKVYTYRLLAADSPEQEDYHTYSRKELISKMWFEWNESCGDQDFEVKTVDVNECGDIFFQSPGLREDLNALYIR